MSHTRIVGRVGLLLWLLLLTPPAAVGATSDQVDWQVVGQVGGPTRGVAVQGHLAYVGVGLRLMVLDVADPAELIEVGATSPFPYFVQDVAISGTRAFVAAGAAGLRVVDISNPALPVEVGSWTSPGYAEGVALAGNTVYLADGPYGLRVIDVSKPSAPVEIGSAYPLNYAFQVVVVGRWAYLAAAGAGLLVADISDPRHPVEVGACDTAGYAYGVAVSGNSAYIADGWDGVKIVSVGDPAHPVQIGSHKTPGWAFGIAISGGTAYVADGSRGLRVLDVSSPAQLVEVASSEISDGGAARVVVDGGTVYVADRNWGLRILQLRKIVHEHSHRPDHGRSSVATLGSYSPMGFAQNVDVAGHYAYVAAGVLGLRVVDISDPTHPVDVGVYDTQSYARSITVVDGYAYVATSPPGAHGLHVVDVHDPAKPVRVGFVAAGYGANRDMTISGNTAFVANEAGLQTIDISDPRAPKMLSYLWLAEAPGSQLTVTIGVSVSNGLAYLAVQGAGLVTVDVTDPAAPVVIGRCGWPNAGAQDLVVAGAYAYVADMSGLSVVDVSDPRNPLRVGYQSTSGFALNLAMAGNLAFIAGGGAGISVVDVSDPTRPILASTFNTLAYTEGLAARDDYLYAADNDSGLLVLRMQAPRGGEPSSVAVAARSTHPLSLGTPPSIVEAETVPLSPVRPAAPSAAPCVVGQTGDQGLGTLRWCLANTEPGGSITFDPSVFPPARPATIALSGSLSLNRGWITIDASNAGVILDGSGMQAGGLGIMSDGNTILGLQVMGFPGPGISVNADWNVLGGNRNKGSGPLGEGNLFTGNDFEGIMLGPGADSTVVSGNVVNGNGSFGILVYGENNVIIGNYVGTDATGNAAVGNRQIGILISGGRKNRVGGSIGSERNVISGNREVELSLSLSASDNVVVGNYIGVSLDGSEALGNGMGAVSVDTGAHDNVVANNVIVADHGYAVNINDWGSSYNSVVGNLIGLDQTGTKALGRDVLGIWIGMGVAFNRIGGSTAAERNVIRGQVNFARGGAAGNLVLGNFIGTDVTGTRSVGSSAPGVNLTDGARRPFIGGTTPGERNVISGNPIGISVDQFADYAFIGGNSIGTDASEKPVPNQNGIVIGGGSHNVIQGNRIAFNSQGGILIGRGVGNTIRSNSICGHTSNGIWIGEGANGGIQPPIFSTVSPTTVSGTACAGCEIGIFSDAKGEGCVVEGSAVADASGKFTFTKPKPLTGPNVTATATDRQGNSSGFSGPRAVR